MTSCFTSYILGQASSWPLTTRYKNTVQDIQSSIGLCLCGRDHINHHILEMFLSTILRLLRHLVKIVIQKCHGLHRRSLEWKTLTNFVVILEAGHQLQTHTWGNVRFIGICNMLRQTAGLGLILHYAGSLTDNDESIRLQNSKAAITSSRLTSCNIIQRKLQLLCKHLRLH